MNIFIRYFRQNWLYFIPGLLFLIFIGSILDRNFYFGGDLLFPINPQDSIFRSIYLWEEQNGGGSFFKYVLLLWQGFFYILSLVKIPIDIVIKIFIVAIYVLGFIFSYLLYRALFKEKKWGSKKFALLFALLFFLNPAAILVVVGTLELYAYPICFFFLVKYLDTKNILYIIPFSFFLNLSFFPGFPQGKPLVVFMISTLFLLAIYYLLRNVKIKSLILSMISVSVISFLLNAFILIPFVNDAFGDKAIYHYYTSSVITYNGDADLYSAAIPFTTRFYNSNLVDKNSPLGQFLSHPIFLTWTFFILFIGLLSVFLTQDKKDKKLVYISLFAFLVLIFIAKGANPPFGEIYRWSLIHIPIAKLFRTTSTSIIGAVIFYTFMVTISMYFISKKWTLALPIIVILHVIILHGIYLGFKLENPYLIRQKGISIPNEYFKMGRILNNLKGDGKVLVLPFNGGYVSKNWSYMGQSLLPWLTKRPVIANNISITDNVDTLSETEICTVTSLYNISYVVREKDFRDGQIKKNIAFPGDKILENQYFELHKTKDSCLFPQIYIPQKSIYFKGDPRDMIHLGYLPVYKNPLILTNPDLNTKKQEETEKKLLSISDNIVVATSSQFSNAPKLTSNYLHGVLGEDRLIGEIIYPFVRINPNSIFYPLVLWKEEKSLKNKKLSQRSLLDLQLFYASKRIKEIDRWGINNDSWQTSQKLFKKSMENAIELAATSNDSRVNIELVYEYIQGFKKKISELSKSRQFWDKNKINSWMSILNSLEANTEKKYHFPDYDNLSQTFFVPSYGNYKGYILLDEGKTLKGNSVDLDVSLNNTHIATYSAEDIADKRILELGTFNIKSKKNNISVHITNKQNIIDNSAWNSVEPMQSVIADTSGIIFSRNLKLESRAVSRNPVVYQEIKKWIPGAIYILRIKHKEKNEGILHLRMREKKHIYDKNSDTWIINEWDIIDIVISPKKQSTEYRLLVVADKDAIGTGIYLSGTNGDVIVESVSLEKIILPHIFFIASKDQKDSNIKHPTVRFMKENPTKYNVTVNNLKKPTLIVFSETFDKGWKIYGKDNNLLPESQHFLVNGYANAWLINSQNTDNNDSNQFIIEYVPQRFFYIGIVVSIISFCACILYGIYKYIKNRGIIRK